MAEPGRIDAAADPVGAPAEPAAGPFSDPVAVSLTEPAPGAGSRAAVAAGTPVGQQVRGVADQSGERFGIGERRER